MSKKIAFIMAAQVSNPKRIFKEFDKDLEYDILFLCSEPKAKILKKDIDLDYNIFRNYDILCPIGAEPLKYVSKMTGITKYNGNALTQIIVKDEEGYDLSHTVIPIIHPELVVFKPQYEPEIQKAFQQLKKHASSKEIVERKIEKDYRFIETTEEFATILSTILQTANFIVVDIETSGLSPRKDFIIGVAFSTSPHEGFFVTREIVEKFRKELAELFLLKKCVFHNGKFDKQFLERAFGFKFPDWEDTMLLHYCLEEAVGTHGLKSLAMRFTDLGDYERELDVFKKEFCRKNKIKLADFSYDMLPIDILAPYACKDGDSTSQLFLKFMPLVLKNDKFAYLYNEVLKKASEALQILENNGGPVSKGKLKDLMREYSIDIEECMEEIKEHPAVVRFERIHGKTFNPNSVKQLQQVFYEILNLKPLKKTAAGAWSTDAETLEWLDHPLAKAILDLRKYTKLLNTYLSNIKDGLDEDNRLRSSFNVHGTTSGRLSSSGVLNYQNIPRDNKDIKSVFVARPGYKIVQCDLGTAEVYYAAVLSKDEFLQKAFIEKLDFHSYVAKQMFGIPIPVEDIKTHPEYKAYRQYAKAITFGIMYQAGPATIAETVNKEMPPEKQISFADAKGFINKYFREAKKLKTYIDDSNDFIELNAYIYSFFGRKRRLPESRSPNKAVAKHAIRSGVNFLVQSVASDINILGLIDLVDWIKENNYENDILPFTVVHDSIVSEVREDLIPEYKEMLVQFLQKDRGISIKNCPIKCDIDIGDTWADAS